MDVVQFLLDNGSSQSIATEVNKHELTAHTHGRDTDTAARMNALVGVESAARLVSFTLTLSSRE